MGYAKRYLLAATLLMLVTSTMMPAFSEDPAGIDPPGVVLPGKGQTATMELDVIQNSVVLSSTLDVMGGPTFDERTVYAGSDTTLGFRGSVPFAQPTPDLSWYLGEQLEADDLDNGTTVDGATIVTSADQYAYQLFLLDIDPSGLYELNVTWTGSANATRENTTIPGANLYAYGNASAEWSMVDSYIGGPDTQRTLHGDLGGMAAHLVNRTLTGQLKIILLVLTNIDTNATLVTDAISMGATYMSFPKPQLDVGGDGLIEWSFGTNVSTGYLGYQNGFVGDTYEVPISLPSGGGHDTSTEILLPEGLENVTEATVDYLAFPSTGERSGNGNGIRVDPDGFSPSMQVTGIPLLSHQKRSSVLLTDVTKHNVTDQMMEVYDDTMSLGIGNTPSEQSLAQTFTPSHGGPINGIDVYIRATTGTPGNLTLRLLETSAGTPTGNVLRAKTLVPADIDTSSWNHFTFDPVLLQDGKIYAFSLNALDASGFLSSWIPGYNISGSYSGGLLYQSSSLNGSQGWSPSPFDICFRTYMDLPIGDNDATNLEVMGYPGNLDDDRVYFNISLFEYIDGNWTFELFNYNDFPVTFNWSAWTQYNLFAESPSIDVGDDGTVEWTGDDVSGTETIDITAGLNRVFGGTEWPLTVVDDYGNVFYRIPLNFSATSEGDVELRNLVVHYHGIITTSDLSQVLNEEKDLGTADAQGIVKVPINITSKTGGTFNVTSVDILYDLPPHSLHIDDIEIPEDGEEVTVLDSIIFDDFDNNNLVYEIVKESGHENVTANLSEANVLTFSGPANWSGEAMFYIQMWDTNDLTNRTNSFNVTILAVNDPPVLFGLEDQVVLFEIMKALPVQLLDNDNSLENITITTDSPRVTFNRDNLTMEFLYPNNSLDEEVEVDVFDGADHVLYWINVTAIESNEPPVMALPESFDITLDAEGTLDLRSRATDQESSQEDLVWSVVSFSEGVVVAITEGHLLQVIPVATTKSNETVVLAVTDPDGNSVQDELTIRIRDVGRHPPVILIGDDALPGVNKVERNGELVINLALQKYWYDQEDYNRPEVMTWEVTSLRPSLFRAEIGTDNKLIITTFGRTGAGYMTLVLKDSEQGVSSTESVRVEVVEPASETSSWLMWVVAAIVLIIVVGLLLVVSRKRGEPKPKPSPKAQVPSGVVAAAPGPAAGPDAPEESPGEAAPATVAIPGKIVQVLIIHESTSLMTQMTGDKEHILPDEKEDDLIEQSTLFAQERFEGANVGAIKAFKWNGNEVIVGKGMNYFLVVRCTGNEFDDVASEMKLSIINIDVGLGDRLKKWYPGQKVSPMEEEVRELLAE